MDIFTLYAGQGSLAAVRAGDEAIIVDAHMPDLHKQETPSPAPNRRRRLEEAGGLLACLINYHAESLRQVTCSAPLVRPE
jgi:hypothetical protein